MRSPYSFVQDLRGTSAIEFAMVTPALLALIFAIAFAGQMYFDQSTLQSAVEKTARDVALNPSMTQSQIATEISGDLSTMGSPTVTVTYTTSTISGASVGHISASVSESYNVPLIKTFALTLTGDTYVPLAS